MMMQSTLQTVVDSGFHLMGLEVRRRTPKPWENESDFMQVYRAIADRTLVSADRCFILFQLAHMAARLGGAVAEVGVFRGGTAKLIADATRPLVVHLFDTFAGMPETDLDIDGHRKGDFGATSLDSVRNFVGEPQRVMIHCGLFPETATEVEGTQFCFVHIDVDIYESVKASIEFFYPRMMVGGIMVVDDYGWKQCDGVKRAIDEYFGRRTERPLIFAKHQCVLFKTEPR